MPRDLPFDPAEYEFTRAPVLDEATVVRKKNGATVEIKLDAGFLRRVAANMNDKFERTGSLSPLAIGHTLDDKPERDQPQVVGALHGWQVENILDPVDNKPKPTLTAGHYVKKHQTVVIQGVPVKLSAREIAEKFPRRSGEVWLDRAEIDPHCLLGATTPERDLGQLRFSTSGEIDSIPYTSPGVLRMAKEEEVTGENAHDLPSIKQLQTQVDVLSGKMDKFLPLLESLVSGTPNAPGAKDEDGHGDNDAEIEKLLAEMGIGGPEGDEEPAPAPGKKEAAPAEDPEKVKLSRENETLRVKLARGTVVEKLTKAKADGRGIEPTEENILKFSALPDEMQDYFISLIPARPGANTAELEARLKFARPIDGEPKPFTAADQAKVSDFAVKNKINYAEAKTKLGF